MSDTLTAFLKKRAERSFRYLLAQVESLTHAEALRDRRANWPSQRWGVGQDGSIAGIVYHVAAWKRMTLPLLAGGEALTQETFDFGAAPRPDDWPGPGWFQQVGTEWNAALAALLEEESALDEPRSWEGAQVPLRTIVVEMQEHDIQHGAQVEYLTQLRLAESGAMRPDD